MGQIPKFDKLIATIRSREISASIILQSQSVSSRQFIRIAADTILGNCDTTVIPWRKGKTTLKEMCEHLGKETIDLYNTSETSRGSEPFLWDELSENRKGIDEPGRACGHGWQ
ncbi:MAG: TraM recognition domain-containing protein [Blautia obeum]